MSYILRVTRVLIALATSLHLFGLTKAVASSNKGVIRAAKLTQRASYAVDAASYAHAEARAEEARQTSLETVKVRQHKALASAAQAEGRRLRRDFAVA